MEYLEHFGLRAEPFSNAPVTRFYYDSTQHGRALKRLMYAAKQAKGLAVLSGGIGAGKTTLARRLLDALSDREFEAALLVIIHRDVTSDWLLRRIALQLGVVQPSVDKLTLLSQLYRRLLDIHERGKKAVVLVDEAQMLTSRELMEELRGLLNLEVPERKLLSFILFGLPEIESCLAMDPPLAQRVSMRVRLEPFDSGSTHAYIQHRLQVAGATHPIFDVRAISEVHLASSGVPRIINTICDNALLEASLNDHRSVGPDIVRDVAENLGLLTIDETKRIVPERPLPQPAPSQTPFRDASEDLTPLPTSQTPMMWPLEEPMDDATAAALEEIDRVLASLGKV